MTNLRESVDDFVQDIKCLNILVIGKTGVGKSTLINAIFGEETAKTGAGFPVTQYFEKYSLEEQGSEIPIVLYDSAGCELGREQNFVDDTRKFLDTQLEKGVDEQIHVAWYLVSAVVSWTTLYDSDRTWFLVLCQQASFLQRSLSFVVFLGQARQRTHAALSRRCPLCGSAQTSGCRR